ncbi:uncharacterized protein LOC143033026 [Oratosquilla oratoria]|uniref:uncharacterized protein LOC143033026 n=1 Tax=Oratosquilla oratoria TaxID=337810 RepID=UPI003F76A23D
MAWFTGRLIVVLAVVICLAARANAALGIEARHPVHTGHPNECPHNSDYVANGKSVQLEYCQEKVCDVEDGMYTFITYTCPPTPQLGPSCSRAAPNNNLPYPGCCPHAAPVSCN